MPVPPKAPPGALPAGAEAAEIKRLKREARKWTINVHPLTEKVNALEFIALQRKQHTPKDAKIAAKVQQSIAWIEFLAPQVPFESNDPLIMLTLGRVLDDAGLRARLRKWLADVDNVCEAYVADVKRQRAG
jgi:hypothetical protein